MCRRQPLTPAVLGPEKSPRDSARFGRLKPKGVLLKSGTGGGGQRVDLKRAKTTNYIGQVQIREACLAPTRPAR